MKLVKRLSALFALLSIGGTAFAQDVIAVSVGLKNSGADR
jgi:hypothetical protein